MHLITLLVGFFFTRSVLAQLPPPPFPPTPTFQLPTDLSNPQPSINPTAVCGQNYNDCKNGFCCSANNPCAGELYGFPMCKDPSYTLGPLRGTAPATPYAEQAVKSSIASISKLVYGATGAANTIRPVGFEDVVLRVGAVWGVAMMGGVGWFFMG